MHSPTSHGRASCLSLGLRVFISPAWWWWWWAGVESRAGKKINVAQRADHGPGRKEVLQPRKRSQGRTGCQGGRPVLSRLVPRQGPLYPSFFGRPLPILIKSVCFKGSPMGQRSMSWEPRASCNLPAFWAVGVQLLRPWAPRSPPARPPRGWVPSALRTCSVCRPSGHWVL